MKHLEGGSLLAQEIPSRSHPSDDQTQPNDESFPAIEFESSLHRLEGTVYQTQSPARGFASSCVAVEDARPACATECHWGTERERRDWSWK